MVVLLGAAAAGRAPIGSTHIEAGNLVLDLKIDFAPKKLPHTRDVPIKVWGAEKLRMKDGSVPPPITHVTLEFDKNGHVETRGLPTCSRGKLVATTTEQARRACPDAIVGTGFGAGTIVFPEQAPIPASSPVTFFNAPPIGGDPAVIVHAHLDVPAPTTYLVTLRIERIDNGSLGYRVESDIPKIAGGNGSITDFRFKFDRRWSYKGRTLSYVNARCGVPGPHLMGHATTEFADQTSLQGSLITSCQVR